jgi:Protein of unknown function (DUF3662)/FHA domain
MKFLDRFERLVERGVEGGLGRILPRSLQPVQIAKAAARAMDEGRVVGVRGPEVPNLYRVRLAPADLARFGEYRTTLARNTAAYLVEYARQRGLRPVSPPYVELVEDRSLVGGTVHVEARFRDLALPISSSSGIGPSASAPSAPRPSSAPAPSPDVGVSPSGAGSDASEAGRAVVAPVWSAGGDSDKPPAARTAAPSDPFTRGSSPPSAVVARGASRGWLVDQDGQRYPLPEREVVRLGRAGDNDLVLDADTVSRHHAELRWQEQSWFVYDLGSTNGTTVAGAPVSFAPVPLASGATLRVGDRALTFTLS